MLVIRIKQGKEKSLLKRDPWIYVSAVERVEGRHEERNKPGATALVLSSSGQFLARAAHSPKSQIVARVWSFLPDESVDHALIKRRVKAALASHVGKVKVSDSSHWRATRIVKGEPDGLPGLLVDWYQGPPGQPGYLVCQFQSAGVDAWKVPIVQSLIAETGCPNVYERGDELVRKGEGLPVVNRALAGDAPPDELPVVQHGVRSRMNIKTGAADKTGGRVPLR